MNAYLRYGLCVAVVALWGRVSAGETFYVVKVSDMLREQTYQVMSSDEYKQLQKQLTAEERNFSKAVTIVGEEWRKDDMNKTTPFPSGRLSARKIVGMPESVDSREKADKRVEQYQTRDDKKIKDKKPTTPADKEKSNREADKLLQARRAADLVTAKLAELAGGDAKPGDKPGEKPAADKPAADKPAADKPAVDKKAAGGAVNKAL